MSYLIKKKKRQRNLYRISCFLTTKQKRGNKKLFDKENKCCKSYRAELPRP